jgi:hypothetical protein
MDPAAASAISAAVVAAANSVGGEAGKQAWASLVGVVRRALGRREATGEELAVVEAVEAVAVETGDRPGEAVAVSLRDLVLAWAREDADFASEVTGWRQEHQAVLEVRTDDSVTNIIGGNATFNGPVIQARDISGTFDFGG